MFTRYFSFDLIKGSLRLVRGNFKTDSMPQRGFALPPLTERDKPLMTIKLTNDKTQWNQNTSQVKSSERFRFHGLVDKISGGMQHWHKQSARHKINKNINFSSVKAHSKSVTGKFYRLPRCSDCGGFLSVRGKLEDYWNQTNTFNVRLCAFGSSYCDVVGPCAQCSLSTQRSAIVEKQLREFPELEVSARRLIAPSLAEIMTAPKSHQEHHEPGESVLRLPALSANTLRYMRREAGSTKQKRKNFYPNSDQTGKKFIEVRLPKV